MGCTRPGFTPLMILADLHSSGYATQYNVPDKVALLLRRGANPNTRNACGNTCLHVLLSYDHQECLRTGCLSSEEREICLKDVLMLMITAGADAYAVNDDGDSVTDIAFNFDHQDVWYESLIDCGYNPDEVYQGNEAEAGWSSSMDPHYAQPSETQKPRLAFAEYLRIRRANCWCNEAEDGEAYYASSDAPDDAESSAEQEEDDQDKVADWQPWTDHDMESAEDERNGVSPDTMSKQDDDTGYASKSKRTEHEI